MSSRNSNQSSPKTTQNSNSQNYREHNLLNQHNRQQQQSPAQVPVPPVSSLTLLNNMEKVNMVPGFILKLWKMINDPQCDDLISWSENGQSFIIIDPQKFAQELSKYFKHNNLSSFIRQLNMYGFRKVATIENSGLHSGTDDLHFYHPDFIRNEPDRLEAIKRKLPQKLADSVDLRNVFKGITEIEDKQKNVSNTLQDIKRENEMLWAELHDLRQKHQQQQLYISRLMKLVFEAMEQNGIKTNMLQIKRNSPLMIKAATGSVTPDMSTSSGAPTTASSPTTAYDASKQTQVLHPFDVGTETTAVTSSPTPALVSDTSANTQKEPVMLTTTLTDEDTHAVKKSRRAPPVDIFNPELYLQQQQPPQELEPTFQIPPQIDINADLDSVNFDASQFQMLQNDQLQTQIDSAEFQIDTLVPTISDFDQDELNLFSD